MEIKKSEYIKLKVSEAMLIKLGINGAVNGRDYDCMCYDDEECIFCADDTDYEGFLGLQLGEDKKLRKIGIKPLSINKAWKGRRFKTKEHVKYCKEIDILLPNDIFVPPKIDLFVEYEFGISKAFDIDNPKKIFQDCLSKKYNFNDNRIMKEFTTKVVVKKGREYLKFRIEGFDFFV